MRRATHAELTKLRTVPSTPWLILALVVFTVAIGATIMVTLDGSRCPSPNPECDADTAKLGLSGVYLGQVAAVILGVLVMTDEYATMMVRTTLAACPGRLIVFMAKACVVVTAVLGAGVAATLGSVAVGRLILRNSGLPVPSLADEPTLRAAVGTVLYLGLVALLAVGVGAIVRDTAASLTTTLTLFYVPSMLIPIITDERWREWIQKYAPMPAGLTVQATRRLDELPIGPWAGLGVLACYTAVAVVVGAVLFRARDA